MKKPCVNCKKCENLTICRFEKVVQSLMDNIQKMDNSELELYEEDCCPVSIGVYCSKYKEISLSHIKSSNKGLHS